MIQLTGIICIVIYGIIVSSVFALKPEISRRLNLDDKKSGSLVFTLMFSGAISVLLISPFIDVIGYKIPLVVGLFAAAIGMFLLRNTTSYLSTVLFYCIISFGSIAAISVGNTLLPLVLFEGKNAPAAANLGNVFYGLGAFMASFLIGTFIKKAGFKTTTLILSILFLVFGFLNLFIEFPENESTNLFNTIPATITNSFVVIAMALNFFSSGIETSVGSWTNTILMKNGVSEKMANICLSLFFISIMSSRLISSNIVNPSNVELTLLILAICSGLLFSGLIFIKQPYLLIANILLLGFTTGSLVPTIFGYLFTHVPQQSHGTAFGLCFAAGLTGASMIPGAIGIISSKRGIETGYLVSVTGSIILSLLIYLLLF